VRGSPAAALLSSELTAPGQLVAPAWAGPWTAPTPGLMSPVRLIQRGLPGGADTQLAAGVRASAGTVGYLGAPHSGARTLNPGDAIPAELSGCTWDGSTLLVPAGSGRMIDNWRINGGIDTSASTTNLTISNCYINGAADSTYGILLRGSGCTVTGTTVTGQRTDLQQGESISFDTTGTVIRCDLMGYQDVIGISGGLISQCFMHDPAMASTGAAAPPREYHTDGIQIFGSVAPLTIEHSWIDIRTPDGHATDNVTGDACVYADLPSPVVHDVTVNNCFLAGGVYCLIWQTDSYNLVFTNNDFGYDPADTSGLGEFTIDSGPSGVTTWSGNRHRDGTACTYP